ncbi:hypothetical protein BT63DRAFT_431093 [Microthyrium microscopicum]|uniref:Protein CMS1 n=1 Tax=Microthyrium microscopicum TaxID=703497 RepID=A0A6A6USR3_9PEZI|nr:hypothetical protein BT63DRAFT_431093 [Microthyrium microscopicum]
MADRQPLPPSPSTKRKLEDDAPEPAVEKKRKIKKAKTPRQRPGEDFDDTQGLNLAIGRMDSQELITYVDSRTKQFEPKISEMELEDQRLLVKSIKDTSLWQETRDKQHMPEFLENVASESLSEAAKSHGSPHTLVVAGAGLRAADLTRALRKFHSANGAVAKLFAKHIKIQESIDFCKRKRITIGVGTPQRIIDLLENGALSSKDLKRVVIDASHVDAKRRGILEMKDTLNPLVKLLNTPLLRDRFTDGSTTVIFY